LRPLHPTRRLARKRAIAANVAISSSVIPNSTACRHLAMMFTPRSIKHKRGIHERFTGSMTARFMETVV
jgi:hypothetical protein